MRTQNVISTVGFLFEELLRYDHNCFQEIGGVFFLCRFFI